VVTPNILRRKLSGLSLSLAFWKTKRRPTRDLPIQTISGLVTTAVERYVTTAEVVVPVVVVVCNVLVVAAAVDMVSDCETIYYIFVSDCS